MSGLLALAKPRRIKASHRRRRKVASGQSVQRYYDPQIGRFLSIDPVTAYSNPVGAFNRYWYANSNPYRFTDPDGRVIRAVNAEQERYIAQQINKLALGTFKFDSDGNLKLSNANGDSSKFSSKYQERLVDGINSEKTITITVAPTYTQDGVTYQVDGPRTNGGLTDGPIGGDQTVVISGSTNTTVQGVGGTQIPTGPDMILMHELVGHAIPNMVGGGSGNAVDNENEVRSQIPGAGQREAQEWHDEDM